MSRGDRVQDSRNEGMPTVLTLPVAICVVRYIKLLQLLMHSLIVIMVAVWAVKRQCLEKVSHDVMRSDYGMFYI